MKEEHICQEILITIIIGKYKRKETSLCNNYKKLLV